MAFIVRVATTPAANTATFASEINEDDEHEPVHQVSASALPTGAATSAKQDESRDLLIDGLKPLAPVIGSNAPSANVAITDTSAAEVAIGPAGYYTWQCTSEPVAGQNGFWLAIGVAGMVAADATNGWHVPPGSSLTLWIPAANLFFRTVRAGTINATGKRMKSGV